MDISILNNVKKILGSPSDYTAFDLDIIIHINAALSSLNQLGIIPDPGFAIEDAIATWDDLALPLNQLSMVKTYVYLKVRLLFDPPTTSFLLEATKQQLEEFETRLHYARENLIPLPIPVEEESTW